MKQISRLLFLFTATFGALPACLDFTPVTSVPDAPDASSGVTVAPAGFDRCVTCALGDVDGGDGPSCAKQVADCKATPKCEAMLACAVDTACFRSGTDLVTCLTPCGEKAGLTSGTDPAVGAFTGLYLCMDVRCAADCTP
jgi:hypothetical protein